MSRYRRAYQNGGCYFFTVVTWHREPVFSELGMVRALGEAFRTVMARRPFGIDAISLMPDHLHCIWRMPMDDHDFSGRWREIKKQVTRHSHHNDQGCTNPVWQPRFWEHLIRDEHDWRLHLDYVHFNPVRHGLVRRPADWPYSSFHTSVARGWYDMAWGADQPRHLDNIDLE